MAAGASLFRPLGLDRDLLRARHFFAVVFLGGISVALRATGRIRAWITGALDALVAVADDRRVAPIRRLTR